MLSSYTISEKTNDPILRELSDGRTDGQREENDFIGRCPTNVERPKNICRLYKKEIFVACYIAIRIAKVTLKIR